MPNKSLFVPTKQLWVKQITTFITNASSVTYFNCGFFDECISHPFFHHKSDNQQMKPAYSREFSICSSLQNDNILTAHIYILCILTVTQFRKKMLSVKKVKYQLNITCLPNLVRRENSYLTNGSLIRFSDSLWTKSIHRVTRWAKLFQAVEISPEHSRYMVKCYAPPRH